MDFTSIIGMVAAFGLMIYGMVNGHDFSVIVDNFVDIPSVYIVFGGVLGCAFAGNSLKGFLSGLKSISLIFKNPSRMRQVQSNQLLSFPTLQDGRACLHWRNQRTISMMNL